MKDAGGQTVASWSGQGATAAVTWNGTSGGSDVPDGVYTAELTATPAGGDATGATTQITVDTAAPRLAGAAVSPASFSPNGDGQAETASVSYSPAEACSIRVGILDAGGDVVRWLQGWHAREARSYTVSWDGRVTSGSGLVAAAEGVYRFDVERRDEAGNIARQGLKVTLDKTLARPGRHPGHDLPGRRRRPRHHQARIHADAQGRRHGARRWSATRSSARWRWATSPPARTRWCGTDGPAPASTSPAPGPTFTVTAVSAIGESSVTKGLVVDLYRPRLYAAAGKTTSAGTATKLSCKAVDPFSAKVDVSYAVTDAKRPPRRLGPSRLAARRQVAERHLEAGVSRRLHRDLPRGRPRRQPRGERRPHHRHRALSARRGTARARAASDRGQYSSGTNVWLSIGGRT